MKTRIKQGAAIDLIVKSLRSLGDMADSRRDKRRILHDCVPLQALVGFIPTLDGKLRMSKRGCITTWELET